MFQPGRTDNRPVETASVDEELHCRGVIGNVAENGLTQRARKDSRKLHSIGDIGDTVTARDRGRMLVDQAVVHPSPAVRIPRQRAVPVVR